MGIDAANSPCNGRKCDEEIGAIFSKSYMAFADACPSTAPLAIAVSDFVGSANVRILDDIPIPLSWLWHGGRVLPVIVWSASRELGWDDEVRFEIPTVRKYGLLPRACSDVLKGIEDAALTVLSRSRQVDGSFNLADLVDKFMRGVIQTGDHPHDRFYWELYETLGLRRLIAWGHTRRSWRDLLLAQCD
jgi:hypothetical protein